MRTFCSAFDKMGGARHTDTPVGSGGIESNPLSILKNVLFVCTGNTCRSPMAEALFRDLVKERADYQVSSAGVAAAPGMPASKHTAALLKERGLDLARFQSRMLDRQTLEQATHVFAMSSHHMAAIADEFPEQTDKIYLVSEFAAEDELRGKDVSDPFGQGRHAYEETLQALEKMLPSLLAYIDQTWKKNER
jgi:protein-tyrosine phosphatase